MKLHIKTGKIYLSITLLLLFITPVFCNAQPICLNVKITAPDIKVCPNTNAQLIASGVDYYTWSPAIGLSDSTIANPIVNISKTQKYVVTGYTEDVTNLISNGNFENGNTGFTSNYTYTTGSLIPEGYYAVDVNPKTHHNSFSACTDHTSGSGKMLIVNGNTTANSKIWGQTITVQPNKDYAFYAYVTPVTTTNPPILQFSINGSILGMPYQSPSTNCTWNKFYAIWNSGSSTTANISIVNQNVIANGNDFAIDDIKYVELCRAVDTVTVAIASSSSVTNRSICSSDLPYSWNGITCNLAGSYTYISKNAFGCDSTAVLNLTVNNPSSAPALNQTICRGDSVDFYGKTYKVPGTYYAHLVNKIGCDSVATLILKEKLPTASTTTVSICSSAFPYSWNGKSLATAGTYTHTLINAVGCDSVATLVLKEKLPTVSTSTVSICSSAFPYSWNGKNLATAGTYTHTLINAVDCDSVATLVLKEKLPTASINTVSICSSAFPYSWNGKSLTVAGTYSHTLINAVGCDSVATLVLKEKLPTVSTSTVSICSSAFPYSWNGLSLSAAGTYTHTLVNAAGCDSVAMLVLKEKLLTASTSTVSICSSAFPYSWNGKSLTAAGTYSHTLINAVGCDSVATLILKEKLPTVSTTTVSICSSAFPYSWNGKSLTVAGTYSHTLINLVGCDSVATLILKEKLPTASTSTLSICSSAFPYSWNGKSLTIAGTYSHTLFNAVGCDSLATLILKEKIPTASTNTVSICSSAFPYSWNGKSLAAAGTYSHTLINAAGCDSVATIILKEKLPTTSATTVSICSSAFPYSWNGKSLAAAGTYTHTLINAVGCDSVATLVLKEKLPTASTNTVSICSSAFPYSWNGKSLAAAGTYTHTLINAAGCDSVATLVLKEKLPTASTNTVSICSSAFPYSWNGKSLTVAGTYSHTLINAAGCDSVATLVLKEKLPTVSKNKITICPLQLPYTWNKIVITQQGTYSKTLSNSVGCDSIATLELFIEDPITTFQEVKVCASELPYLWNGISCKTAGKYTARFTTPAHCDSIATLSLRINPGSYSMKVASICQNEIYQMDGYKFSLPGQYNIKLKNCNGCDSIVTLDLKVNRITNISQAIRLFPGETYAINGKVYNHEGTYYDVIKQESRCDSVVITELIYIKIPNTITPNGDGRNEVFMAGSHVQIYNRNGILLYDGNNGWDGKYRGNYVANDTYYYVLYYESDHKTKTKLGYITIVR